MKRAALFVLIAVAGCSKPDLSLSRLDVGQKAILVTHRGDKVGATGEQGSILMIPAGTPVRIARDSDQVLEKGREVSATVLEGELQGQIIKISRWQLKPTD